MFVVRWMDTCSIYHIGMKMFPEFGSHLYITQGSMWWLTIDTDTEEALQQIKDRGYSAELQQKGIRKILSLGLAFRGKQVEVLSS